MARNILPGCFDHYPTLRPPDDGWARYAKIHDWLHFGQALTSTVYSNQNFELLSFLPWTFVPWHLLFANVGNTLPEYPRVDYEVRSDPCAEFQKRSQCGEVRKKLADVSDPPFLSSPSVIAELPQTDRL